MTLDNLVSREELNKIGNPAQIDKYLLEAFGLADSELDKIRAQKSVLEALLIAGNIIKRRLEEKYGPEVNISAQFTRDNLSILTGHPGYKISGAMIKSFGKRKKALEGQTGLRMPTIQLFREEIGVYNGNLYDAKQKWKKLQASSTDWLVSTRIPTEIDFELAYLVGIIFADGNIHERGLQIVGKEIDYDFYKGIVQPLIQKMFNERTTLTDKVSHPNSLLETHSPAVLLSSRAVETFLKYHFGFPEKKEDYALPKLGTSEQKTGLFCGILAGMGAISGESLTISDTNSRFANSVRKLAVEVGYNPSLCHTHDSGLQLRFKEGDKEKLYTNNHLLHPKFYSNPNALRYARRKIKN